MSTNASADTSTDVNETPAAPKRKRSPKQASEENVVIVKPGAFIRWAGSKRVLAPRLLTLAPESFNHYHEPFVGAGALFWALAGARRLKKNYVSLSDACGPLVTAWRGIKRDVDSVVTALACHAITKVHFLKMREVDPRGLEDAEAAAWFIYLNKTDFNGMWRVNKAGRFNVPWGRWEEHGRTPLVLDEPALRLCADTLNALHVSITERTFETVLAYAKPGDFVYMDPPYLPTSPTADFTTYVAGGFRYEDHVRLRDVARELKEMGVHVMVSNSDVPLVCELYESWRGFKIDRVTAPRSINSKAEGRGSVSELVIR